MDFKSTWYGKTTLILLAYTIFWFIFYGSYFLIPEDYFDSVFTPDYISNLSNLIIPYIFFIVPILSFFMAKFLKSFFKIRYMYLINLLLLIILVLITIYIELVRSAPHWLS